MSELLIKICGVRSPEIARVVAEQGADFMGLIFAQARRQVTDEQARRVVAGLDGSDHRPKVVGVFVNESVDEMNRLADSVGLDYIQLSGDETVEIQAALNRPVIRALRLPVGITPAEAHALADEYLDCSIPARALLLDTHVRGSYGGNGIPGDWNIARALAERYPVILAGGLRPETVGEALGIVEPMGVDVSSGVETDGVKDAEKITKFITAARTASLPAGRSHQ